MRYKAKRKLRKLTNRQIAEDIKKYIRSSHEFYNAKVPELKTLAKRLYDEYELKDFYRVFNRLWKSGYNGERCIALNTLQLYHEEFDLTTWEFLKPRLKEVKSWDNADIIGSEIIGFILLRYPEIKNDLLELLKSKNIWFKRMAIVSILPSIKNGDFRSAIRLIEHCIYEREENIQKAIGWMLREIGNKNPDLLKKFLIKNKNMPEKTFFYATEDMKSMRRIRKLEGLDSNRFFRFLFGE